VEETGAAALEPFVRVELAELARLSDDREGHNRELHDAERLFAVIGAPRRAAELANRLAARSAQP
jgi:hypothetical protein